jgi:hypothetical protein
MEEEDFDKSSEISEYQSDYPGKGEKGRLRMTIAVVIVVIIVVIAGIIIIIKPGEPEISDIFVNVSSSQSDDLLITVLAGSTSSASLAGKGEITVTYEENVVYTSRISIDDGGTGEMVLPLTSFLEGNGEYSFQARYKGKLSPPASYKVNYVVESLDIWVSVEFEENEGTMKLDIFLLQEDGRSLADDLRGAIITVNDIQLNDDGTFIAEGDQPLEISEDFIEFEYPYSKSGNYTVNITLENTMVNPDSVSGYYRITETWEGFLNVLPIARAFITNSYFVPNSLNYSVEFDAILSLNDGDITKYIWDFNGDGDIDLETTEPYANYSGYFQGSDYNAALTVEGDVVLNDLFNEVEKGSVIIPVQSP